MEGKITLSRNSWLNDLAGAWIFYTILPSLPFIKPSFKRIARFAPIIGLIIGALSSSLWIIFKNLNWQNEALILINLAFYLFITGGIHLDGLIDTGDGLGAGKNRCLEAMEDSRIGANGIKLLSIIIAIQIAALIRLGSNSIIALPIAYAWGRFSPLIAISSFAYLSNKGSASFHKKYWQNWKEFIPSTVIFIIILITNFCFDFKYQLINMFWVGFFPSISIPFILGRRIGGHNGDSYGACVVIVETITLFILAFFIK
tara:strand:- start:18 stop:791 length:774 start_codon:yes stop_codon:yes gene_type:complete